MTEDLLALLRCPLDPSRSSSLVRQQQELVCDCGTRFPVKQGLPVLIAEQAELPCAKAEQLRCRRRAKANHALP